jgi:TRAP transporter 4TM/12TM fusion protein
MSGSAIANVTITGAITIPAMKELGYSPHYAGAVEACASTGGVLMPPIMGATVFIMAQILGISYATIMVAAFIPAILYYLSLLCQVDAYAAKKGLKGLPKAYIPSLKATLKEGWPYLFSLAFLVFQLFYLRIVSLAPFYASALLLAAVMIRKKTRMSWNQWLWYIVQTGRVVGNIMATLLGVGFIIGALLVTGVAYAFSDEVILLAGENIALLLVLGAMVSFVLGMGLTISACYILLALTMAPPLVSAGFDPLAVHLFVMYCGMLSFITPPVALSAFAASGIADASPVKTGLTAMRLGIILYIVPFVFVIKPALIFNGPLIETFQHFSTFALGIFS